MLQTPNPNKNISSCQYEKKENPLHQPVSDINVPMLSPQPLSRLQRLKKYLFDKVEDTKKYATSKCNNYVNWLLEHVPPKPKVIDKAFELANNSILKLFPKTKDTVDVVETKSALQEIAKQYMITGRNGYDPDSLWMLLKKPLLAF